MTDVLFLTSKEIRGLATPAAYVNAVREGYRDRGNGAPAEPRTKLMNAEPRGMLTEYSAILPSMGVMGGYSYASGFGDADAHFFLQLFDSESGQPLALLDGASLNPFKTGAAGAVGVDALARPDASTLGLVGSGAQAAGQLRAVNEVRDLQTVHVFSPTAESRESFAAEFNNELDVSVSAVSSPAMAVENADIVVTATKASRPVFDGELLAPGTHITAMGQYSQSRYELDTTTIERSVYVPDLRDRAFQDAGSFLHALNQEAIDESHIHAELGEVVAGVKPGRKSAEDITVFDSGGTGVETVAAAKLVYEAALEAEVGTTIALSPASEALTGR
jgi:alanine dehydrogenase